MIAADADVDHDPSGDAGRLDLGGLYAPPRSPVLVDVPALTYLAVDGTGPAEGTLTLAEAVDALRAAAPPGRAAGPVELLHHPDERWTALLAVRVGRAAPTGTTDAGTTDAATDPTGTDATGTDPAGVRRRVLHERWAAQLLHTGDAAGQESGWRRLERFVTGCGYLTDGPRHEIVLDADGARRRILRRAVRPARTD